MSSLFSNYHLTLVMHSGEVKMSSSFFAFVDYTVSKLRVNYKLGIFHILMQHKITAKHDRMIVEVVDQVRK